MHGFGCVTWFALCRLRNLQTNLFLSELVTTYECNELLVRSKIAANLYLYTLNFYLSINLFFRVSINLSIKVKTIEILSHHD